MLNFLFFKQIFNVVNVFTVSFEQIIVSFLEKTFNLFQIYGNGNEYSLNII